MKHSAASARPLNSRLHPDRVVYRLYIVPPSTDPRTPRTCVFALVYRQSRIRHETRAKVDRQIVARAAAASDVVAEICR